MSKQVQTISVSIRTIVNDDDFWEGIIAGLAGQPLPLSTSWEYERGRQFAMCCRRDHEEIPRYRSRELVQLASRYFHSGEII